MNEYSTTHPFPSSRFNFFARKFAEVSYIPEKNMAFEKAHLLVIAKLAGYFGNLRLEYSTAFMQNEEARLYFEGFTSLRKQNFKEAEKIFTEMLKKYGENPYLHEVLGQIKVKQENYNDAIFHFSKALELKPDEFLFLLDFAEVYAIKKDFQKAIFYAEKALKKEPYNPQVTIKLAEFYSKKGESGIAKLYFIETEILQKSKGFNRRNSKETLCLACEF
jgi:predicted Zn-dependent protease